MVDESGFNDEQLTEFNDDGELISATPQLDLKSAIDEFFDYEPTPVLTIEEQAGKPDPELEDEDDFEDVLGVVSIEQAAGILEVIQDELEKPLEYDEKKIPTGAVKETTAEEAATMSLEELNEIEELNDYT